MIFIGLDEVNYLLDSGYAGEEDKRGFLKERFRFNKIYLKASKCYLGYSELNYLGTIISHEGLKMSKSKIQSVIDFSTPTISEHLKSFLGIANYFRDFVRNLSSIVKQLHSLLQNYNKTKKIVWTVETLAAFTNIKTEISNCIF